jgi:8-oxo-dGTP pyrophosphatase MutT (NUDIX family)
MSDPELLSADDPRLAPSARLGDAWAAIAPTDVPQLRRARVQMRELLATRPLPLDRVERPGHFTGSALVVDPDSRRTLLLLHAKLGIWVQPGGHADGNANLPSVALREATEETGIEGLRVWPEAIDLDVHEVDPPAEDTHLHHDVRFLVVAPPGAVATINHESHDHRWAGSGDLDALGVDGGTRRLISAGLAMLDRLDVV